MRAQWRWPIGMPLCRAMGRGLWEIRTELPSRRIARVLLCVDEGALVALHAFIKKTQKAPDDELALALHVQPGGDVSAICALCAFAVSVRTPLAPW